MASRIMHLAVASQLTAELPEGMDIPRFLLGSVMVDAAPNARKTTHFQIQQGDLRTYDVARFRALYGAQLRTDGLVLGYYLHLLQDLVFRCYMYRELRFDPRQPGYLDRLYGDYWRLNGELIRHFGLRCDLPESESIAPLTGIADFDLPGLMRDLRSDFVPGGPKQAFFLTTKRALNYIEKAAALCRKELYALQNGLPLLNPLDGYTWQSDPAVRS